MFRLKLTVIALAAALAVSAQARAEDAIVVGADTTSGNSTPVAARLLNGLEPEILDASTLKLHAGSCADSGGVKILNAPRGLSVNFKARGLNGIEGGEPAPGQHYFIYVVETSAGEVGAIASPERFMSKFNEGVRFPFVRKLPWGFVYRADGIPALHISGWPKPFTRYTNAESTPAWSVLKKGVAKIWSEFSVARFVPDNARLAYLMIEIDHDAKSGPARAFMRVTSGQTDGLMVGRVARGGTSVLTLHQRLTSNGLIYYRVEPGARMTVYVLGYSNTEPS